MTVDWGQIWLGLGPTALGSVVAYLGLRQARKKDDDAARSGLLSNHRENTNQAIEVLRLLVNELQEENATCQVRLNVANTERDAFRLEIARLRKKYSDNGDTPLPPNKP